MGPVRRVAALAVLAAVPVLVLGALGRSAGAPPEPAHVPPYPIPAATARLGDGTPWRTRTDLGGPVALLYVTEGCPHCRADLASWASLASTGPPPPLWVVVAPGPETLTWVPPELRARAVVDHQGSVGRSLGVRAVPVTFWVDGEGVVRWHRMGRSPRTRLLADLGTLAAQSGPAGSSELRRRRIP
ncbi:MAG: hypothetical protein P8188_04220 [Gemmatimonadota bacterium]